jgi:hypothetical protein
MARVRGTHEGGGWWQGGLMRYLLLTEQVYPG